MLKRGATGKVVVGKVVVVALKTAKCAPFLSLYFFAKPEFIPDFFGLCLKPRFQTKAMPRAEYDAVYTSPKQKLRPATLFLSRRRRGDVIFATVIYRLSGDIMRKRKPA